MSGIVRLASQWAAVLAALVSAGGAHAVLLPATPSGALVYNFDYTSQNQEANAFRIILTVNGGAPLDQVVLTVYDGLDGQGSALSTTGLLPANFSSQTSLVAPWPLADYSFVFDGQFSLGLYAPGGGVSITDGGPIARLWLVDGRQLYTDGVVSSVPEPGAFGMMAAGVAALLGMGRQRRRGAAHPLAAASAA